MTIKREEGRKRLWCEGRNNKGTLNHNILFNTSSLKMTSALGSHFEGGQGEAKLRSGPQHQAVPVCPSTTWQTPPGEWASSATDSQVFLQSLRRAYWELSKHCLRGSHVLNQTVCLSQPTKCDFTGKQLKCSLFINLHVIENTPVTTLVNGLAT